MGEDPTPHSSDQSKSNQAPVENNPFRRLLQEGNNTKRKQQRTARPPVGQNESPVGQNVTKRGQRFRNWEQYMRKRDLEANEPPPPDYGQAYRYWEQKLVRGELDGLLETARQTWILDKLAALPQDLALQQHRTFWEVTPETASAEARTVSEPAAVSRRPRSNTPKAKTIPEDDIADVTAPTTPLIPGAAPEPAPVLKQLYAEYFEDLVAAVPTEPVERLAALTERVETQGRTLMVHDLLNKFTIDDVLRILDEVGATHVDYVFLPLSTWDTKKQETAARDRRKTRNKAYCFVHFSDASAADHFTEAVPSHVFAEQQGDAGGATRVKRMSATLAANQGVVGNLLRLVDLPNRKWHPRAGSLCVRVGGVMQDVSVLPLREMLVSKLGVYPSPALAKKRGQ